MDNDSSKIEDELKRIQDALDQFIEEVELAQKEHKEKIDNIIEKIKERKIKEVQEKIKSL